MPHVEIELLAKLKEPRLEYHVRLRFRGSGFAFQMKSRICIVCSFVIENLDIFQILSIVQQGRLVRSCGSHVLFQRFAARMRRRFSK